MARNRIATYERGWARSRWRDPLGEHTVSGPVIRPLDVPDEPEPVERLARRLESRLEHDLSADDCAYLDALFAAYLPKRNALRIAEHRERLARIAPIAESLLCESE